MNSPNEREKHSLRDIIHVFLMDFKKDFDCKDVEKTLRAILKKKEVDGIIKSPGKYQIYRLFWTLYEQPLDVVQRFVEDDTNRLNYDYLMSAIRDESRNPSSSTENYISERDRLYNDNQKFTKYNVPRIEPYLELQKALLELRPSRNVAVEGVLGSGKQWLVLDVCSSYDVQRKMDFKIFWLNVRDCRSPENQLELLQSLLHQIAPSLRINFDQSVAVQIERVKAELRHLLKDKPYKNCLLVLRNVQNKETWKAFNLGCKILLTTRHKSVVDYLSPVTTTHVTLRDELTPSETESLFVKYLPLEPQESLKQLANVETSNPLLLSFIAENIRDGICTLENWKNINFTKLTTIIKNSLNELKPSDKELFEILFIFPETAHIPIKLLGVVWSGVDPMIVVNRFYKYSLVEKHTDQTITLPSIYSELNLSISHEATLSKKIVDFYDLPKLFSQCNDTTLPPLDCYFYSHIGHHLSKVSDQTDRVNLFRMIFLDFRFLEQKIRNDTTPWNARGSILHTLHIIKFYRDQIEDNERHYKDLVNALLVFLTKVEEKLISSQYTSLLRIALMSEEGPVYDEALRQVQRFPHFVWFTEHGRFHQHREIINLGKHEVRHAIYLDDDYCLMALSSQQLLLTDVSLAGDTTCLLSDENDPSDIIEMRVLNKQKQLLTLHKNGSLKLWSLMELLPQRPDCVNCHAVRPSRLAQALKHSKPHCYEQLVNSAITRSEGSKCISAFHLDENVRAGDYSIQLHVAFDNGHICILNWDDKDRKFVISHTPSLKTEQTDIRYFSKILNRFYVVWSDNCNLTFWNLQNGSPVTKEGYAPSKEKVRAMETYIERLDNGVLYTVMIIIYEKSVWRLKFKHTDYCYSLSDILDVELLPFSDTIPASITCGKLSTDGRYLILGTLEGLVVYDLKFPYSLLRSNVSERIVCLDVYSLQDPIMKYIVLCGAKGKHLLHIHTLRSTDTDAITWVHHVDESDAQLKDRNTKGKAHLEPNVYMRPILAMSDNGTLYAVDSRARIHQIQAIMGNSTGRRESVANWSTIATPHMECGKYITALCANKDGTIYAGYNNGQITKISDNQILPIESANASVDYLKEIDSKKLIASCRNEDHTIIFSLISVEDKFTLPFYTMYARLVYDRFLIIFSDCGVFYLDRDNISSIVFCDERPFGFDLKNNLLYLAIGDNTLEIYNLLVEDNNLESQRICKENINNPSQINHLTASNDGQLIALGFKNGNIELYSYENHGLQLIYTINQGHETCNSMQLRFSPCKQVLVSCAEQICFWNVKHMRNNQASPKLRSRRHNPWQKHFKSKGAEEVDAARFLDVSAESSIKNLLSPQNDCMLENRTCVWADKRGNDKLPELLACIKFVGNEARHFYTSSDFTQFFVIDDEGVFYHLKVLENRSSPSVRTLDHVLGIHQIEQKEMILDEQQDDDDDDGIDHLKVLENRSSQSVRTLDHVLGIRQIEQKEMVLDEQQDDNDNDDDDGIDVVGSGDILPDKQSDQI